MRMGDRSGRPLRFPWSYAAIAIAIAAGCGTGTPVEDCPRGTLDTRYCDRDGDLVADPPGDPAALRDPERLVFAYTPVEDPAVYRDVWSDFLDHLSTATGKDVDFFAVQSNAAQVEAMRAGRLHVAGFNTGSVPIAVDVAGFRPIAMMAREDGGFGYEMELITRAESELRVPDDLRGRTLAFTSPTSNSGYKAPRVLLEREFGLVEGEDYAATFSGKHDNSILGVVHGDYEAAAVANSVLRQMGGRGVVDLDTLRTLYRSVSFPTTAYGVAHDLVPELVVAIERAFFTYDWRGSPLGEEFAATEGSRFVPVDYGRHWEIVRTIDAAVDDE